ncbi:N-acetylneuraminate synthase family protein, partial [Bacteroidota bacterium]|nr:N-acetylneuraminate synthase family protein [Bacteroidota bacterium]
MKTKIIAEAGSNHNGCLNTAYKLVEVAYNSKADYVKFQIINPKSLYVPYYWKNDEKVENVVFKRRLSEQLTYAQWTKVKEYADKLGIPFTASVFDKSGVDFLIKLNVPFIKLASSDLNNTELIIHLIISTGMASITEIKNSVGYFLKHGKKSNLTILHCVSVYPCDLKDTNLNMLDVLKSTFSLKVGFSDHTLNSKAACVAAAKKVSAIEKHFTIDKSLDGFDHLYASSPSELTNYINDIRSVEASLVENKVKLKQKENITKIRARRGLYLNKAVKKGTIIKEEDVVELRPSNSLNPKDKLKVIGMSVAENINEFESIKIVNEQIYKDEKSSWADANSYWIKEMKAKKMFKDA